METDPCTKGDHVSVGKGDHVSVALIRIITRKMHICNRFVTEVV